jgi:diacylglycerol kinase family enzyme
MATIEEQIHGRATASQRWLARGAILAAGASVLVPLLAIGFQASLIAIIVGVVGLGVIGASVWWALTHKGIVRWLAVGLAVLVVVALLILYTSKDLVWVVLAAFALLALAVALGRAALRRDPSPGEMPGYDAPLPRRPYLIMNPRSGGGKVAKFGLKEKAEALGAEVVLLEGPGTVDVGQLARTAVANGADLLGVAGGDGTQALVAAVASEHDLPLLVISAGTRNHFALDLGLDRQDPSTCLDGLRDGVELRVDLGFIGDRPFVNNSSFGAYAAIVQSPAYRDDKAGTTADMLPDLLVGRSGPHLVTKVDGVTVVGSQAVLVSNNVYGMGDVAGLGRRARLDRGVLGVVGIRVRNAAEAAALLAGRRLRGITMMTTTEVVVDADADQIPVGVDGEALLLDTPVRCTLQPGALRVRVPRHRPGVPEPKPVINWHRLWQIALAIKGTDRAGARHA